MRAKSKVFSFSAIDEDLVWIEGFKERLGSASFSKAIIDGLKSLEDGDKKLEKARALGIDVSAIIDYHIRVHAGVSMDPTNDQTLDFFEKLELNRNS